MARGITGRVDEFHVRFSEGGIEVDTNCGIWSLSPSSVGLKYLVIRGDSYSEVLSEVSRDLVWLRWFKIGQPNLPTGLVMKNLRVLEVFEEEDRHDLKNLCRHDLKELWVDSEAPLQLRHLLISGCTDFQGFTESIGRLTHLKKIEITDASSVTSLPDEFCFLKSLEYLTLVSSKLELLPINFGNLTSLRHLDLSFSSVLRTLPASFKNLSLLQLLNLYQCRKLTLKSEEELNCLQNVTKLEYLSLGGCERLEELPRHISNNVSLTQLRLRGCPLREVPENIGQLSKLKQMFIEDALMTSLPISLRCLSSLTELSIGNCPELECLPDSFGDLSSLTVLSIRNCPELECLPDSLGDLSSLTELHIRGCPKLECLPESLAYLSSLRRFRLLGRNRIVKIQGIENCIGLEELIIESRMGVPGIESLEHLRNLRELKLSANKGAVIERCIQRMQEWPSESTIICAPAVPDAASLLQSLLPSNVEIVDSISNQKIESGRSLQNWDSATGGALMLCYVINCVSSQATFDIRDSFSKIEVERGRWAWVSVYTPRNYQMRSKKFINCFKSRLYTVEWKGDHEEEDEVERGVAVMGEEGTLMEAFQRLWPLFIQS